jgi:hypothetical protein
VQTSMVFNQAKWPGARDVDDCWAVSGIQCVNVTAPWLRLVSIPAFRRAAGKPDTTGADGGQPEDIKRGVESLFPAWYRDETRLRIRRQESWESLVTWAQERPEGHRPLSIAVVSAKLPTRIQFGFLKLHQLSLVVKGDGTWLVANPLAPVYSRWERINPAELRPAVMAYGRARTGQGGAWFVAFPSDEQMAPLYAAFDDTTPFDQEDVDQLTAAIAAERDELAGRIDAAQDVLDG